MTNLQSNKVYCNNDVNNENSMEAESSSCSPLDTSMCMLFTGYYNGISVEIRSLDEMALIHHMGCFGKGTASRSKPQVVNNDGNPPIMRRRQFVKRNYWYKRFGASQKNDSDSFFKDANDLIAKIVHDTKNQSGKDVIDLVSSEDEDDELSKDDEINDQNEFNSSDKQNLVIIVPNSDSEDENYFANLKPKCCINKILLQEKLMLSLEESFFLLYGMGCLQIVDREEKVMNIEDSWKAFCASDKHFLKRYVVYHYFRSKGYIVKSGIKFGGDYLLYKDGPGERHADYIVVINYGNQNYNVIASFGHVRMAKTTVKEVLIAEVVEPTKENTKMPQDLCEYKVRELVMTGKIPIVINNDNDID